jgi:hypothetical protein
VAASFGPKSNVAGLAAVSTTSAWVWGQSETNAKDFVDLVSGTKVTAAPGLNWLINSGGYVSSVGTSGPKNAWLVGLVRGPGGKGKAHPTAAHWNGTTWSRVSAAPDLVNFALVGATSSSTWVAVKQNVGAPVRMVRWTGKRWATSYAPPPYRRGADVATFAREVWTLSAVGKQAWLADTQSVDTGEGGNPIPWGSRSYYYNGRSWRSLALPSGISWVVSGTATATDGWLLIDTGTKYQETLLQARAGGGWCTDSLPKFQKSPCFESPSAIAAASDSYLVAVGGCAANGRAFVSNGRTWRALNSRPSA